MVGTSGDSAVPTIMRAPRSTGDCTFNNITLDFSPDTTFSSSGGSGALGPCLLDSRLSPPHCTSFLPFSSDQDHPPPILHHVSPKTDEGNGQTSFISLSGVGVVGGSSSSRGMRVGLLRRQQLSTSSASCTSSSSTSSSSSLGTLTPIKYSLDVQISKCPISVGGPTSQCNLHQHSSSSLSLCPAKESTNSVPSQQISLHTSPSCAVAEGSTDSDDQQQHSSSSSESCVSSAISVSHISPLTGPSNSAHLPYTFPTPTLTSTLSFSSPSSSTLLNFSMVGQSKGSAFAQPPIAVACHNFADLVLLDERNEASRRRCPGGSSKKLHALKPLQAQASRGGVLHPDMPLVKLENSSGRPRTKEVVHELKSHALHQVGGDKSNLLRNPPGATLFNSGCTHASGAVPTLTFGSFQIGSGNYFLTDSDEEDSSDGSHGYRNSLRAVQQQDQHCMGIPRPLLGSFIKNKQLKSSSVPPAPGKVNTRSVIGLSSIMHTSCGKGGARVVIGGDNLTNDGIKKKRASDTRFGNGNDARQLKQGSKFQFPDPFESRDIKFCKRVSQLKSLVAQTIRWEQKKHK